MYNGVFEMAGFMIRITEFSSNYGTGIVVLRLEESGTHHHKGVLRFIFFSRRFFCILWLACIIMEQSRRPQSALSEYLSSPSSGPFCCHLWRLSVCTSNGVAGSERSDERCIYTNDGMILAQGAELS